MGPPQDIRFHLVDVPVLLEIGDRKLNSGFFRTNSPSCGFEVGLNSTRLSTCSLARRIVRRDCWSRPLRRAQALDLLGEIFPISWFGTADRARRLGLLLCQAAKSSS